MLARQSLYRTSLLTDRSSVVPGPTRPAASSDLTILAPSSSLARWRDIAPQPRRLYAGSTMSFVTAVSDARTCATRTRMLASGPKIAAAWHAPNRRHRIGPCGESEPGRGDWSSGSFSPGTNTWRSRKRAAVRWNLDIRVRSAMLITFPTNLRGQKGS